MFNRSLASASAQANTRTRYAALLGGTALGVSLLVVPTPTRALDDCGVNTGAPIVCPPQSYPNGVQYTGDTPIDLTVSGISTSADYTPAVAVTGGAGSVTVDASNIDVAGRGSVGVRIGTTSGDVEVVGRDIATSGDDFAEAIYVTTDSGDVRIDADATSTRGTFSSPIAVESRAGNITVISGEMVTTSAGASALYAATTEGGVSVSSARLDALGQAIVAQGGADVTVLSETLLVRDGAEDGATGVFAYSTGGGDVMIDSGTVSTSAVRGRAVAGFADAGSVTITSDAVETFEAGSPGIRGSASGDVTIVSGSVVTHGGSNVFNGVTRNSEGIWASSPSGAISIDSGSVETHGDFAMGILVDGDGLVPWTGPRGAAASNGTGVLSISSASVTTSGTEAYGILVDHQGALTIDSGSIHTTGLWGHGLYVYGGEGVDITSGSVIVEGAAAGLVARTVDGDITIDSGYAQAFNDVAIGAFSTNGDVRITSAEALTTQVGAITHPDGFTGDAVIAQTSTGSIFIDSGKAETRSDYAWGVGGLSDSGAVTLISEEVVTNGVNGYGVYAQTAGDVSIDSGSVVTRGATSVGVTGISTGGDVVIASDSVGTHGVRGFGIVGQATAGTVNIDSGAITTTGDGAYGVRAVGRDGVVIASDIITTSGSVSSVNGQPRYAHGIWAESAEGAISIDAGVISVSGQGATGVNAVAVKGTVSVGYDEIATRGDYYAYPATNAQGQPITVNAFANGVYAQSQSVGDVAVFGGDISVEGMQSWALYARAFGGAASIDVGALETFGEGSRGIYAVGLTDVAVTVDSVHTRGGYGLSSASEGVWAWSQTGTVDISAGSVVTEGGHSHGLFVQAPGAVTAAADSIATSGDNAHGLQITGSGGPVAVDVGSVQTAGLRSDGVRVESGAGAAVVKVGSVEATGDGSAGVRVISTSGAIDIEVASASTSGDTVFDANDVGTYAEAVTAYSDSGDIVIKAGQTRAEGLYASNVSAESQTGDIAITSGTAVSTAVGAAAVAAATYQGGDISLTSDSVTSLAAGVQGQSSGDLAIASRKVSVTGSERATALFGLTTAGGDLSITSETIETASNGGRGIYADAAGDIVIASGTIVSTAEETAFNANGQMLRGDGIAVYSGGQGSTQVTSGSITTQAHGARGLALFAQGGEVTIDGGDVSTAGADAAGITASNVGAGSVSLTAGAIQTAGEGSTGVSVITADGDASASIESLKTAGAGADGVYVNTTTGEALLQLGTIEATGGLTGTAAADGVVAVSQSGAITVGAGSVKATGEGAMAVFAQSQSGAVSVDIGEAIAGDGPAAVWAESGEGDIAVAVDNVRAGRAGVVALGSAGVNVDSGDMVVAGVSGASHGALTARSSDGAVTVVSDSITHQGGGAGLVVDAGGTAEIQSGVVATSGATVPGAMRAYGVSASSAGRLTLASQSVTTAGAYAHGIVARGNGGDAVVNSGSVSTTGDGAWGIDAVAASTLSLTSGTVITAGDDAVAVHARSNGDATVSSGSITTTGARAHGLMVTAADDVTVTTGAITASGADAVGLHVEADDAVVNVTGNVVAAGGYGAMLNLTGAGEINLAAGSSLEGGIAGLHLNSVEASIINILGEIVGLGGTALVVEGAPVTVNNHSNTIIGGVQLTAGADTFNNNGTWVASGQSDFGAGDDVIVNNGLFSATGAGGVSVSGLETFQNNAEMDLRNGAIGDQVDLGSAAYVGGAGSALLVDVDFATGESDSLAVGSASGTTEIVVNNVSTQDGFSPGLAFIESETPLTGTEFTLDPESIEDGFVDYDLEFDPATNSFVVKALPSNDSVSMLRAGAAAQDYASKSGEAWSGRLEDLRDSGFSGQARGQNEVWGQMLFGERELEQSGSFDLMGVAAFRDLSSDTSWLGMQMGVDRAFATAAGQAVVGFTAGVMDYRMSFAADDNRFDANGFNVGAYAAWTSSRLTVGGLVKYDQFDITANLAELGAKAEFDGSSVDLQAEAAYRFGGPRLFVEPVLAADWIKADLDDLVVAGATADFADIESLRVRVGARLGAAMTDGPYTVTPFVGLYAIDELEGENGMDFTFGASSYEVTDIPYDMHGRLDFGGSIMGPMGLNAFVKSEIDFGDGAEGMTLRIGARWSW